METRSAEPSGGSLPSLRMTANLNALINSPVELAATAAAIVDGDVAHHVIDPEGVLGLDPLRASELATALPPLAAREHEMWVLVLPMPGVLGGLRGPRGLNEAALDVGEAVVAANARLALVPYRVGRAVQWRVFTAERPFSPASPYDAERALSEAVLSAATTLARLDVAGGPRPREPTLRLAPGYDGKQHASAHRALLLLQACGAALAHDGGSISSYEADVRFRELRTVRDAAAQALCSTASWMHRS